MEDENDSPPQLVQDSLEVELDEDDLRMASTTSHEASLRPASTTPQERPIAVLEASDADERNDFVYRVGEGSYWALGLGLGAW